ncbi:choice-of-anchor P family protein [Nocardioides sp. SYSU DS0651]|uniref:choice-of-anchor P family protein n=1 Tax=Nocardioides sp. SYSU DS0651 TaxID=3415955 RepID=UPI003F4C374C
MNVRLLFTALLISLGLVAVPVPPAQAAEYIWNYSANTGATYVKAVGGTITSDATAQSSVSGGGTEPKSSSNSTLAANVGTLLRAGAVESRTSAEKTDESGGTTLRSFARTANLRLLNGLITVDAIETNVATVGKSDGTASATGNSQLLGIHIIGVDLPVRIPQNYSVTIPGVANISLNYMAHVSTPELTATRAWAIGVQLLEARDGFSAGTTIIVNPVNQYLQEAVPSNGARLAGFAYGTRVQAKVGDQIKVVSDPTAYIATPYGSSNGNTQRNTTATVNIPSLLNTGAVTSTTTSSKDGLDATVTNTHKVVGLNLLSGLIKADAIEVSATGRYVNGQWTSGMKMTAVNLVVAGRSIPINVSPNTSIDVAGLGKVEINKQQTAPAQRINRIDGIKITLDTARAGLPVGAVIELAVAATGITPQG